MTSETQNNLPVSKKPRNLGLDLLKALLALMILMRHSNLFAFGTKPHIVKGIVVYSRFAYFWIESLAVPVFMVVSLYFFVTKRLKEREYFEKRVVRLLEIIIFWWPLYYLLTKFTSFPLVPDSWLGVVLLPLLNGSMYFLSGLLFSVIVIEVIVRALESLDSKYQTLFLAMTTVLSFGVNYYLLNTPNISPLMSRFLGLGPLAFIIYPSSVILFCTQKRPTTGLAILAVIGIVFQAISLYAFFGKNGFSANNAFSILLIQYNTPLAVPVSLAVFSWFKSLKIQKLVFPIRWIAVNCLGIYLIHPIVNAVANQITNDQFSHYRTFLFEFKSGVITLNLGGVALVLAISIAILMLFSVTPLKRFVR